MPTDPRKLKPAQLCRLLNSTPLGEVITDAQLRRHRSQAGLRIGDHKHVDLLSYVAWLVQMRHVTKKTPASTTTTIDLNEAAEGAAELASSCQQKQGHGQKLTLKQELVIAALLTEPSYKAAAGKAGIHESTLYRWMKKESFRTAYRHAKQLLLHAATTRIQAAAGQAVDTLLTVAGKGRRDSDRVRAAIALLDQAYRGLGLLDSFPAEASAAKPTPMGTSEVVTILAARLRQLDASDLSTPDKARLSSALADSILRAINVDVLDKRIEALQTVLTGRKESRK